MNKNSGFINKINLFFKNHLLNRGNHFKKLEDLNELETVICLERILNTCYSTLEGKVHDLAFRYECRRFEKQTEHHQGALSRIFSLSQEGEAAIVDQLHKHRSKLGASKLLLKDVFNLACELTVHKINIYRYLSSKDHEHRNLLNRFIEDGKEEQVFLKKGVSSQVDRLEDAQFKVVHN